MQHIGPASQPFELSDGILAFCLYLSGVPFLTTRNIYSAETLRKLGFKGEVDLAEAALECVAANKKGDLKYLFKRPRELKALLKIFSDQERRLKDDTGDAMEAVHSLMEQYGAKEMTLNEAMMRIACIILKLRGPFLNRWKEQRPLVQINNAGREQVSETTATVRVPGGGTRTIPAKMVQYPGFKILSANASEKTKKRMGLE